MEVIHRLRAPDGCPWDREQTPSSLKPFILEEAYELCDAIDQGRPDAVCEELGDLLLQVVLQAEIGSEDGGFDIADVCRRITAKLVRRHPHVFAGLEVQGSEQVLANWEIIKQTEKTERKSVLDGVPASMPALLKAHTLGKKASRVGFDWPDAGSVLEKIREELQELVEIFDSNNSIRLEEEVGDLMFATAQFSRRAGISAEQALERACRKFHERFSHIEQALASQGRRPQDASMDELEELWAQAKRATKPTRGES